MKLGILTLPFHTNYGGILQAYALQRKLEELGCEVCILQRDSPKVDDYGMVHDLLYRIRFTLGRYLNMPIPRQPNRREIRVQTKEISKFFDLHMPNMSPLLIDGESLKRYVDEKGFDGIIVGSDQVWRPQYSPDIKNYFLDFCQDKPNFIRLAYAASFGTDEWEFSEEDTKECGRLLSLFNAVSVREKSGVSLCRNKFGTEAVFTQDPTLFFSKEDYMQLVDEPESKGNLFCPILDMSEAKADLVEEVSKATGMIPFRLEASLPATRKNIMHDSLSCAYPRVTTWLRAFQDSKMVITDSFHACIFSIIYHVPFWTVGSKMRGNARFQSLLEAFNLQERQINLDDYGDIDFNKPIDWEKVDYKRALFSRESESFLKQNLFSLSK